MKRKLITVNSKTREELADPFSYMSLEERVKRSPELAIDPNEFRIEEDGHYMRFVYSDNYERRRVQRVKARLK